jgi:hypothetical protein
MHRGSGHRPSVPRRAGRAVRAGGRTSYIVWSRRIVLRMLTGGADVERGPRWRIARGKTIIGRFVDDVAVPGAVCGITQLHTATRVHVRFLVLVHRSLRSAALLYLVPARGSRKSAVRSGSRGRDAGFVLGRRLCGSASLSPAALGESQRS